MGKRGRPRYPDVLTPREQEVLALVREGLTNGEIAERLSLSADTVKTHVSQILSKLNVATREEAAAWVPEAEGEGWTWRRWVIAGLGTATVVGAVAVLGLLAWGVFETRDGDDQGEAVAAGGTGTPVESAVTGTPRGDSTSQHDLLTIENPEEVQVVFVRGQRGEEDAGTLRVSNLDGSDAQAIIDEPVVFQFLGIAPNRERFPNAAAYYATLGETSATDGSPLPPREKQVWKRDLVTGGTTLLASYLHRLATLEVEDISGDGRYLAYADVTGVHVLDLDTGLVADVLPVECAQAGSMQSCSIYARVEWTPDGSALEVEWRQGEGSSPQIVLNPLDPDARQVVDLEGVFFTPGNFLSQRACTFGTGQFSDPAIYVSGAPDWQARTYLSDFESSFLRPPQLETSVFGSRLLSQCVWLGSKVFATTVDTFIDIEDRVKEIIIVDAETGEARTLGEEAETNSRPRIAAVPSRGLLLAYYPHYDAYPDRVAEQITPQVIDPETNARLGILEAGDRIVDVIPVGMP